MTPIDSALAISPQPAISADAIAKVAALKGRLMRVRHRERDTSNMASWPRAIGDRNPLFADEEYGLQSPYGSVVAHPCWLYTIHPSVVAPGLPGIHSIVAGTRWTFHNPVFPGDRVIPEVRLLDVRERQGRFAGRFVEQLGHVRYHDGQGTVFAVAETSTFRTARDAAREIGKYADWVRHRWTSEELRLVEDAYDAETIRGDHPRYWEDVAVGDEIAAIVKGPLAPTDIEAFVPTVAPARPYAYWLEDVERHPALAFMADDLGWWESWDRSLIDGNVARLFGFPDAHDAGIDRVSWCASLLTNWAGDHGWLQGLDVRLTLPNIYRDATWCKGRVEHKSLDDDIPTVWIDLWCENQRGDITAQGRATVRLPSLSLGTAR